MAKAHNKCIIELYPQYPTRKNDTDLLWWQIIVASLNKYRAEENDVHLNLFERISQSRRLLLLHLCCTSLMLNKSSTSFLRGVHLCASAISWPFKAFHRIKNLTFNIYGHEKCPPQFGQCPVERVLFPGIPSLGRPIKEKAFLIFKKVGLFLGRVTN